MIYYYVTGGKVGTRENAFSEQILSTNEVVLPFVGTIEGRRQCFAQVEKERMKGTVSREISLSTERNTSHRERVRHSGAE